MQKEDAAPVLTEQATIIESLPKVFFKALMSLFRLKSLDLSYNSLTCEVCVLLWLAIKGPNPRFPFLRVLDLSHNLIAGKGALYLYKLLPLFPSLTRLNITSNRIFKGRLELLEACGD
jgi:Ran GTPase-activating protein (RanGAP) involved in mRNA processing and transport